MPLRRVLDELSFILPLLINTYILWLADVLSWVEIMERDTGFEVIPA